MSIIFISGLAVILAALLVRRHYHRRPPVTEPCHLSALQPCGAIIDKALECLSSGDSVAVCRNHRVGHDTLRTIGRRTPSVYHGYMLDAADKIAEISRRIVTSPDCHIPISYKCEIETIREGLARLWQLSGSTLREDIALERDFITHVIAVHSKGMTTADYDDGSPAYSYLVLLYYLHSFISSFANIVKHEPIHLHHIDGRLCAGPKCSGY